MNATRLRRLVALMKKEALQVWRDPSCILIAFVLPVILLFIFGFGLSLDAKHIRLAVILEDRSPVAQALRLSFEATEYIKPIYYESRRDAEEALVNAHVRGLVVVADDFSKRLHAGSPTSVQLITDGVETNTATILENYVIGVVAKWGAHQARDNGIAAAPIVNLENRVRFNTELESRNALIPGSIVLIMAIIGTLLTSLVVAREWERGTMEAMMATPVTATEILVGKLVPYFILGLASMTVCFLVAEFLFAVPFRGSLFALYALSSVFLLPSLGMGLLISSVTKNQFLASQIAMLSAFLPAFLLSGFIFEINSMPNFIRIITYAVPARHLIPSLQSVFLAGDIWPMYLKSMAILAAMGVFLLFIAARKTKKRIG